jgi:DNA polymerase (family X)
MTNREIADLFETVSHMLAIRGDQVHRVLAYQRAAESIRALVRDLNEIYAEGRLTDIPNIGATLSAKIIELLTTGRLEFYEKLAQEIPPPLVELLRVEGLGPKRIKQLYELLAITTLEQLTAAAAAGKLRDLPGMGAKSEAKILAAIESLGRHGDERVPLGVALPLAEEILAELRRLPGISHWAVAGSLRRMKDTIGDIDLMVAAADSDPVMDRFRSLGIVESVSVSGPSKTTVTLLNGRQADLRVLPAERWGTLLLYFTGSKEHNVRLREMALKKGLSLNEHAFTPLDGGPEIVCATEAEAYQVLGLPYIPPTLREDWGEIEAALRHELPQLIETRDIVADLHMHSTWSDGKMSVLEMARAARSRGHRYMAITDHSLSLAVANGLTVERLLAQAEEIRQANEIMGGDFRILHGTEMEIRADGTLDFPDEVLAQLDFVIASLHMGLSQPRQQVTERMLAAIHNPQVHMIAHPSGRMLPERIGADLDMDAILQAAVQTGTILEINANPRRLDLRDTHVRRAVELGVTLAINCDAHHADQFDLLPYGIAVAQRGWATAADVVNTWPLEQLLDFVQRKA